MAAYYIVLDFEMNPVPRWIRDRYCGLATEIIEIGAVKIDAQSFQVIDRYTRLVKPQLNWRIEPTIVELTGITRGDVVGHSTFAAVMEDFTRWLGHAPTVVYSWSLNDLHQLKRECNAKGVPFPRGLSQWVDFQKQYAAVLGIPGGPCMSLEKAARLAGIPVKKNSFHRAMYDAEITAMLVQLSKTGMYQFNSYRVRPAVAAGIHDMTYSIGDRCSDALGVWLSRFAASKEKEFDPHDVSGNPAYVRPLRNGNQEQNAADSCRSGGGSVVFFKTVAAERPEGSAVSACHEAGLSDKPCGALSAV